MSVSEKPLGTLLRAANCHSSGLVSPCSLQRSSSPPSAWPRPAPSTAPPSSPSAAPPSRGASPSRSVFRNVISRLSNLPSARKYHQTPHMKLVFRHNQQQPVSHNYRPSPRNIIFIAYPLCYNHIYFIQFYIHISTY